MMFVDRFDSRPTMVVFAGRAIAQAGIFSYLVLPAFRLSDAEFNAFTIAIMLGQLLAVAPGVALQQHLIRLRTRRHPRDLAWVLLLGVIGASAALVPTIALTSWQAWLPVIALGSVLSLQPMYASSVLALQGEFARSALVDVITGLVFGVTAVTLFLVRADATRWAWLFLGSYAIAIVLTRPLAARIRSASTAHSPSQEREVFRQSLFRAVPMIMIGMISMAFNRVDYLILTVVASESEAARYAVAGRIVGPVLVVLGSLNNSLYVRQISAADADLGPVTRAVVRRVGTVALAAVPVTAVGIGLVNMVSPGFESKALLAPSVLLAVALVPFAFAVPFSLALASRGLEHIWLRILGAGMLFDALLVLAFGRHGAVATAIAWVVVQCGVSGMLLISARRRRYW